MIGEPIARDSRTYYLIGNKIVAVFDMATDMSMDKEFLESNPTGVITGTHRNHERWMIDNTKPISEWVINNFIEYLIIIDEDHPISKIVEMYKLIGALPDVTEDWSNDGPI